MKEKTSRLFKLIATEIIVLCLHRAAAEIQKKDHFKQVDYVISKAEGKKNM